MIHALFQAIGISKMVKTVAGKTAEGVLGNADGLEQWQKEQVPIFLPKSLVHWPACEKWKGKAGRQYITNLLKDVPIEVSSPAGCLFI